MADEEIEGRPRITVVENALIDELGRHADGDRLGHLAGVGQTDGDIVGLEGDVVDIDPAARRPHYGVGIESREGQPEDAHVGLVGQNRVFLAEETEHALVLQQQIGYWGQTHYLSQHGN